MANSLGSLVVRLGLDAAEFTTGLTKSEVQARRFAERLDREIASAAKIAASAFVLMEGAIVGAAFAMDRLVKQAAGFKDIEERTGASAETLASFAVAANVAGTSANDIGDAMNKLAKNLTGVDDESKAAGAALTALGIPIKEFKQLDPAAQVEALAKAFGQFDDLASGGNKAAAAIALLGKSGANLLPFFKELESGVGRQNILTKEQIKLADEYADAQARTSAQLNLYAQVVATTALPALTGLIDTSAQFIKELLGINAATGKLASDNRIRDFAEDAARSIAFLIDAADGLIRAMTGIGLTAGAAFAQVAAAAKLNFGEALAIGREWRADMQRLLDRPLFSTRLNATFAGQREAEQQRRLEDRGFTPPGRVLNFAGAVSGARAAGGSQKERISEAQRYLEQLEQQLQKTQELTTVEKVLADIGAGRLKIFANESADQILAVARQIDAAKELTKAKQEQEKLAADEARTREQISRMSLQSVKAAQAETEALAEQNRHMREETELIGKDVISINAIIQARIDETIATKEHALAMRLSAVGRDDEAKFMEDQIRILRERKGLLVERGIAENLAADAAAAAKYNELFVNSFADAATGVITNTQSISKAIRSMEATIVASLTRITTKNIGEALFGAATSSGGGGLFSGLGGFLQSLLGGGSTAGATVPYGGGFAAGGRPPVGRASLVGERGPEMWIPDRPGTIVPNSELVSRRAGRGDVHVNVNVLPGATRSTADQAALRAGVEFQRALARNG